MKLNMFACHSEAWLLKLLGIDTPDNIKKKIQYNKLHSTVGDTDRFIFIWGNDQ